MQGFDQWLLDALTRTPVDGIRSRTRFRALSAIRALRLKASDPLVQFSLDSFALRLPLSHDLPLYKRKFPQYARNLGRISVATSRKYAGLTILDVGANVGDSAAILRSSVNSPILCVEGDDRFFSCLRENVRGLGDIEVDQAFVGKKGDRVGIAYRGRGNVRASLDANAAPVEVRALSEILARHPRFSAAKLLKLDIEGFDCRVIACESDFLARSKPVLFFEYDPHLSEMTGQDALPTFSELAKIGYSAVLIYQNVGDYLISLSLSQTQALEDVHHYFRRLRGYCDVAAFHRDDLDLFGAVRALELSTNP